MGRSRRVSICETATNFNSDSSPGSKFQCPDPTFIWIKNRMLLFIFLRVRTPLFDSRPAPGLIYKLSFGGYISLHKKVCAETTFHKIRYRSRATSPPPRYFYKCSNCMKDNPPPSSVGPDYVQYYRIRLLLKFFSLSSL